MKALITDMERAHPHLRQTMLAALGNVVPTHLLDRSLAGGTSTSPETPLLQITRAAR